MNNVIFIIMEFLNADKEKRHVFYDDENGKRYEIRNAHYILNQIIRLYELDIKHYHISEKAEELWYSFTDESIMKYRYNDLVKIKTGPRFLELYKGNSKTPKKTEKPVDQFKYRQIFHDEHITPIQDIIDELESLDEITEENVIKILDKIHICTILKNEDKKIKPRYHRSTDYKKVLNTIYEKAGVITKPMEESLKNHGK